jgi:hypothetical protein
MALPPRWQQCPPPACGRRDEELGGCGQTVPRCRGELSCVCVRLEVLPRHTVSVKDLLDRRDQLIARRLRR